MYNINANTNLNLVSDAILEQEALRLIQKGLICLINNEEFRKEITELLNKSVE